MRDGLKLLIANVPSILFVGAGVWMSSQEISGWGWLIFIGIISLHVAGKEEA